MNGKIPQWAEEECREVPEEEADTRTMILVHDEDREVHCKSCVLQ